MAKKLPLITDFDSIPEEALVPGAEQPYEIPSHWKWVRFGSINSYTSRSITPANSPFTKFTLFSVPSFAEGAPELLFGKDIQSSKQMVELNDVLVCKINPRINRVWVVDTQYGHSKIASSEWIVFRPTIGLAKYFQIYFSSPSFRTLIESEVSGVGGSLTRARPKLVAAYPVPLPPVDEQRCIVDYIEKTNEKIDDVIQRLEQYLEAAPARRNELIQAGVNGHLTSSWRVSNQSTKEDWTSTTLGDLGTWGGGGTPKKSNADYWEMGNIPWVTPKDMKQAWITQTIDRITDIAVVESSARLYEGQAICVVTRSGILRRILPIALIDGRFTVNQDMKVLFDVKDGNSIEYVYWYLLSHELDIRNSCSKSGTTVESIDFGKLKDYEIPLPPINEQGKILEKINQGILAIDNSVRLTTEAIKKLRTLRDKATSAVLTGKLIG